MPAERIQIQEEELSVQKHDAQYKLQQEQYKNGPYHRHNLERPSFHPNLLLYNLCIKMLPNNLESHRILGVGAGDCALETLLANKGASVYALDPMRTALSYAHNEDSRIKLTEGSATQLPFPNNSFSIVTVLETLEHIPPDQQHIALRETRRVIETNGQLTISVPLLTQKGISPKHYKHYQPEELEELLRKYNFEPETIIYYREFGAEIKPHLAGKLARAAFYLADEALRNRNGNFGLCECEPHKAKGVIISARAQ